MNKLWKNKFLWIGLCFVGLCSLGVFTWLLSASHKNHWEVYTEVQPELLQQVRKSQKKLVLIVGTENCDLCKDLLRMIEKDPETLKFLKKHAYLCYIDDSKGPHQKSIHHSLFQISYPVTYVFDSELNLFSYFRGSPYDYASQLKRILTTSCLDLHDYANLKVSSLMPTHYENIRKENVPQMLGNSFLANIYLETAPEKALQYAKRSIEYGSFFYNNYIAHKCLLALEKPEEAEVYKKQALFFHGLRDWFHFEDEFAELGVPAPQDFIEYKERLRKKHAEARMTRQ
ncbi:MAG: hypothetical protein K2M86_06845 [Odoribacter sp.]|nr:hypothetical protein [Odoribacter sp.]